MNNKKSLGGPKTIRSPDHNSYFDLVTLTLSLTQRDTSVIIIMIVIMNSNHQKWWRGVEWVESSMMI